MATALSYPTISGVTGAPYISALTDVANIQDAINYLYYGSTKTANTANGIYGMLYNLPTKAYVDAAISGINVHETVKYATTTTLAATYANGTSDASGGTGIGATITFSSTGVQAIDGGSNLAINQRILVKNGVTADSGTSSKANGVYVVTTAPAVGVAGILTRSEDSNNSIAGEMGEGDFMFVSDGGQGNTSWVLTSPSPTGTGPAGAIKIGTDQVTFVQFSGVGSFYLGTTTLQVASTNQNITGILSIALPGSSSGTTILQPSATASGTLTLPATTDTLIAKATTDTLTNKSLSDSTTWIVDATDNTKRLNIDVNGTTGITGTLQTAFTTAKTITFPDTTGTVALTSQSFYIGTQSIGITQATGTITSLPGVTSVNGATIPSSGTLAINPTTTKGDLIYASATGTPGTLSALAVPSTDGYLLTYNSTSGLPEWRVPLTTALGYIGTTQTTSSSGGTTSLAGINTITSASAAALALSTPNVSVAGAATSTNITIAPGSATTSSLTLSATGGNLTINSGAATLSNNSNGSGIATSGNIAIDVGVASAFVQSVGGTISIGTTNATGITIGGTVASTLTLGSPTITATNATTLNLNGASPSIVTSSTGTASVFNTNALVLNIGNAATTASIANSATTLSIGNTATAAQTVNMFTASTGASTYNFATGATASSTTKTLNIGTGAAASSTTNITLGSSNGGTTTINSPTTTIGSATVSLGTSTGTTINGLGTGATTSATTKTVNVGTAGVSGSITVVNIGSAVSGSVNRIITPNTLHAFSTTNTATTVTLTAAMILNKNVIQNTTTTAVTYNLDTGTNLEAAATGFNTPAVGATIEWNLFNDSTSAGAITIAAGTGHTYSGTTTVAISTMAKFLTRKTAAATYITTRIF